MKIFIVRGMTCAACQARVEKAVRALPQVKSVSVSLLTNQMAVEGDVTEEEIIKAVNKAGYEAIAQNNKRGKNVRSKELIKQNSSFNEEALKDHEAPKLIRRLVLSLGFLFLLMYISMGHNMLKLPIPGFLRGNYLGLALSQAILSAIVIYINRAFFISGFRAIFHMNPNMDSLVALGSSVSFCWSIYVFYKMTIVITHGTAGKELVDLYHDQLYFESVAMIPALITVGKLLEALSKGRTTDALKSLVMMKPKNALVERDGKELRLGIDEIKIDDIVIVKAGEQIPVDGIILEGETAVDESALTGEAVPLDKGVGDKVSQATINQSGYIKIRAKRVGEDTTFSQIVKMVSDAAATKAPIARIADKVSLVFVPTVMIISVMVFIIHLLLGREAAFALEKAISVLVISCPCALGLATPVAIMVGNGKAARNAILFKTSEALERTGRLKAIALDKTGTITEGKPKLTDIILSDGVSKDELLEMAYLLEIRSEHPYAKAIVEAVEMTENIGTERETEKDCPIYKVINFKTHAGNGIEAEENGNKIYAGNLDFIKEKACVGGEITKEGIRLSNEGKTPLFFARDEKLLGIIAVSDVIRKDSCEAVKELKAMGIEVFMVTGDNERTAKAIGKKAGIDNIIAGVLPDKKEEIINGLKKKGQVAMVGDGINDAPALTSADIGIAIGAGTDIAIDSADIVLMNSSLMDVAAAVRLSRATLRNIYENLFWAFAYNIILIPMAAGLYKGINMNPMWGALAMSLSSFTVCMNALRLNLVKIHNKKIDKYQKEEKCTVKSDKENNKNNKIKDTKENNMIKIVKVEGMMCPHCEASVKKALEALDGVVNAEAKHEEDKVIVNLDKEISEDEIKKAIEDAGYNYNGIE